MFAAFDTHPDFGTAQIIPRLGVYCLPKLYGWTVLERQDAAILKYPYKTYVANYLAVTWDTYVVLVAKIKDQNV